MVDELIGGIVRADGTTGVTATAATPTEVIHTQLLLLYNKCVLLLTHSVRNQHCLMLINSNFHCVLLLL
jgi:hypothetical protein